MLHFSQLCLSKISLFDNVYIENTCNEKDTANVHDNMSESSKVGEIDNGK